VHRGGLSGQERHQDKERSRNAIGGKLAGRVRWDFGTIKNTVEQAEQDREASNKGERKRAISGQQGADRDGDDCLWHGQRDLRGEQ
jgi:hypothetical protein